MRRAILAIITTGAALFANSALAIICNNPLPTTENRQIQVTWTAPAGTMACVGSGSGNSPASLTGWGGWIEKDENAPGVSGNSNGGFMNISGLDTNGAGTWSLAAGLWGMYDEFVLGFKFGGAGSDPTRRNFAEPDWFLVQLSGAAAGGASGTWDWYFGPENGLSHVSLFARCSTGAGTCVRSVPEPGTLALFGLGLAGLGFGMRRRRKT